MNNAKQQDIKPNKTPFIIPKGKTRVGKCMWCGQHALLYNMGAYDYCLACVIEVQRRELKPKDRLDIRLVECEVDFDGRGVRAYYDNDTSSICIRNHKQDTPLDIILTISHESIHYTLHKMGMPIESYQFDRLAYNNALNWSICYGYISISKDLLDMNVMDEE